MTSFHNDSQFTIENNILKGKEVSYPDDYDSLGEFILASMEKNLDAVGQIDGVTGQEYTYRTMRERSVRCALWMRSQGLSPGDVIGVCSENQLDLPLPAYAALYLGAVYNPWDLTMRDDFHHLIKIIKPIMVFTSEGTAAIVAEAGKKAEVDLKIIVFGRLPGFLEFETIIAEPKLDEVTKFVCAPVKSLDATALIMFTSGTTGFPKGVAQSSRALIAKFHHARIPGLAGNACLYFGNVGGITGIFNMLWSPLLSVPRIVTPLFEEDSACALIEKYKATQVFLTPTMINRLLKSDAMGRYDLSSLTGIYHGVDSLSVASIRDLAERLPNANILSCYGMTEAGGGVTLQSPNSPLGSCGQILKNVQLKVVDPDTGRTLGANRKGELFLKSASMMNFYYNNPDETAKTIDAEGWLHSGDLGYYDKNGEVFVVGRLKDVIRIADHDISPFEIESVILSHPGVKDVAVVGQPRPRDDDLLMAFVVRTEDSFSDTGRQVTETDIVDLVTSKLPDSRKHLGAGVRFIDRIPRTASGKIRRIVLRDMARS